MMEETMRTETDEIRDGKTIVAAYRARLKGLIR